MLRDAPSSLTLFAFLLWIESAYREGVVIAVCKGCNSKHLIADNLGWTKFAGGFTDGETNIEEFLEARGEKVSKVSKDVWELEKLYYAKENIEEENK